MLACVWGPTKDLNGGIGDSSIVHIYADGGHFEWMKGIKLEDTMSRGRIEQMQNAHQHRKLLSESRRRTSDP